MTNSMHIASSGMGDAMKRASVAADNLANLNSTGYKQRRVESTESPAGGGVTTDRVTLDIRDGHLSQTSNPLDLAIFGLGFFRYQQPDGAVVFSRNGNLRVDAGGQLVNADGLPVLPQIQLPDNYESISVSRDGQVSVRTQDGEQNAGQLEISRFSNPQGLEAAGGGLYQETAASGVAVTGQPGNRGMGHILQGFQEDSNVDPIAQQLALIEAETSLIANTVVLKTQNEMHRHIVDMKNDRKPQEG